MIGKKWGAVSIDAVRKPTLTPFCSVPDLPDMFPEALSFASLFDTPARHGVA
jgi:hypothetical protein